MFTHIFRQYNPLTNDRNATTLSFIFYLIVELSEMFSFNFYLCSYLLLFNSYCQTAFPNFKISWGGREIVIYSETMLSINSTGSITCATMVVFYEYLLYFTKIATTSLNTEV